MWLDHENWVKAQSSNSTVQKSKQTSSSTSGWPSNRRRTGNIYDSSLWKDNESLIINNVVSSNMLIRKKNMLAKLLYVLKGSQNKL